MTRSRSINKRLHGQSGVVVILFALLLSVLLGFMALAVDVARLYLVQVELQNAADAGALAGALSVSGSAGSYNWSNVTSDAQKIARSNFANGSKIQQVTIDMGYCTPSSPSAGLHAVDAGADFPAVQVTIDISSTKNSGPLHFFFAPILGTASSDVQASAIAAQTTPGHSILVQ
jgi:Flp pilus assembly protein TadG